MYTIKTTLLLILFTSLSIQADVKQAASLSPQDIGAYKWIIGATAKEGEVVILRYTRTWTTPQGKKHVDTHDDVSYNLGKRIEGSFVAINPDYFNMDKEGDPSWHIKPFRGSGWCDGEYNGSSTSNDSGSIRFKTSDGDVREYKFLAIVMSYEKATKLYPNGLPKKTESGWSWGGSPTIAKPDVVKK